VVTRVGALARRDRGRIGSPRGLRAPRALVLAALTGVVITALLVAWWFTFPGAPGARDGPTPANQAAFEERTGIRVTRVAVTGRGGLLDLRYIVIDAQKAQVVHESLFLVDENGGEIIATLFMGHVHKGDPRAGYTYPVLFVIEQGQIQQGGRVSVVAGDSKLEHVTVR